MSDTPSDVPGQDRPGPYVPSGVRRSSYTPPPPGTPLPTWDDDALAAALEEQVRTYTSPITLPVMVPTAPEPVAQPVAEPDVAASEPAVAAPAPVAAPEPVVVAPEPVAAPIPAPSEPDHVAVDPFTAPPVDDEQLLQEIQGVGTLDAMQRVEEELRRRSAATGPVPVVPETPEAPDAPSFFEGAPPVSPPAPGPDPVATPDESAQEPVAAERSADPFASYDVFAPTASGWGGPIDPIVEPVRAAEPATVTGAIPFAALQPEPETEPEPETREVESDAHPVDPWDAAPPPGYVPALPEEGVAVPPATDLPDVARRAELPPPPGYAEDGSPAAFPVGVPPLVEPAAAELRPLPQPEGGWEQLLANAPLVAPASLENDDVAEDAENDDVVDPEDRAPAPSATPLPEPLLPVPLSAPAPSAPTAVEAATAVEPAAVVEPAADAPPALIAPTTVEAPAAPTTADLPAEPPASDEDVAAVAPRAASIEQAGIEPTPREQRAGRAARLFWLWFAATASILSLGLGAVLLGTGMSLRQAVVATVIGIALSFIPLGFTTLAGKWSGQPTVIVSRAGFGTTGNLLPTVLAILVRIFWGGVLLWLLGDAVGRELVRAHADAGLGSERWAIIVVAVGAILTAVVAVAGYGLLARVQLVLSIVTGVAIVGAAAVTLPQVRLDTALTLQDGPWALVVRGAVLVFAVVGLAWAFSGSDIARYQRPGSSGTSSMLWATFGAVVPPFVLVVWGALLAASSPSLASGLATHPLTALAGVLPSWTTIPLLVAAAVGLLSGSGLSLYSGGFALQSLTPQLPRVVGVIVAATLTLVAGVVLVLIGADTRTIVGDVAILLAVPVAAWAGIFGAEMMIRQRRFHTPSLLEAGGVYPAVRWVNLVGLVVISALGYAFVVGTHTGFGWEGYGWRLAGVSLTDPLAAADLGVLLALVLGILVPLATAIPAIRRQESAVADPAVPRT